MRKRKQENAEHTSPLRRPHSRHRRHRRDRRSPGRHRRRASSLWRCWKQALKRAERDAGAHAAERDRLARYRQLPELALRRDPEKLLAARLGAKPTHRYYGPVGGESPIRYLHEAAKRIARGEGKVAAICGAESQGTATKAARAKIDLPWTPFAHHVEEPKRGAAFQKPLAVTLGVFSPSPSIRFTRPATSAHWGQTPREAMAESGALWARYSEAAPHQSAKLDEARVHADDDHDAVARQSPDRLALHQTASRQPDRQHGRRADHDVAGACARGRHPRGSA